MSKHKIVIVGGGFGGLKTALSLCDDSRFDITLISDHDDFRVYPALYRITTGGAKQLASIPLKELFAGKSVQIVTGNVEAIDRTAHSVTLADKTAYSFDGLVLALGVKTNYFHIEGLEELSYGIKTLADAQELKAHLHKQMIQNNRPDQNYVIIGGGPTGVELAGSLPLYLKKIAKQHNLRRTAIHVDLIEAAPRLLPRMPKDISMMVKRRLRKLGVKVYLKTAVQAQTADALMANNKPIRSHTVIWTAGVANHPFFTAQGFQLAKNGKVRVDQYLQSEPGIYVIGDNADTPYSGLAQTALYDGKYVARNLKRLADKKNPTPYRAVSPANVIPVGSRWAIFLWRGIRFYGFPAWVLRGLADLVEYHDYEPWHLATKRWIKESVEEEDCQECLTLNSFDLKE